MAKQGKHGPSAINGRKNRKNITPRTKRVMKKTAKRRSAEEYDAFMAERGRLERKGLVLCEEAGGEECNNVAEYLHRTHDSDDHAIPTCTAHWCEDCISITGPESMQRRLKHIKQPLHTKYLQKFVDECERKPLDTGTFDIALYGMATEILELRSSLRTLFTVFDRDEHLMYHLKQNLIEQQLNAIRRSAERYDK